MCSTTGFNIPSIDIDYSNVACRHDSALIDAEGELLLGISAIVRLNYDRMIFSNYPVCHTFDLFNFYYVDVFNLSGVWLLSSAPWIKGSLVQNDILASHDLDHLCMKMPY